MIIYKDERELDDKFPFCIERYHLKEENNAEDSFHYHSFCEITYVESGKGHYYVNGSQYEMNEGDLIIFNNVEPHGWTVLKSEMQVLVIIFQTELVHDPANVFSGEYLEPFMERGSNFKNKVEAEDATTKIIYEIMLEVLTEYKRKEEGFGCMIKADILRILTYLIRHYQKEEKGTKRESLSEKKRAMKHLEKAFFYINSHYTEKISLEEVADLVYLNPNYFSGLFKKVTNRSFSEYVTNMRLKKAKEMYLTTDQSMATIAMACGFRNMSNFYRLYKKHMGKLPQRKKNRFSHEEGEANVTVETREKLH